MTEFVRVKLANGAEASVSESFAESHDLKPLDKPAADARGRALADKPKTSVAPASESKSKTSPKEETK